MSFEFCSITCGLKKDSSRENVLRIMSFAPFNAHTKLSFKKLQYSEVCRYYKCLK